MRTPGVGMASGALAGLIACGGGSRLAMRLVSLTSERSQYGQITEAEAVVGQITLGGTIFLLLAGTFAGVTGGIIWMTLRSWLYPLGRWRGPVFGAIVLGTFGSALLDSGNFDFTSFGSPLLNLAMFAAIFVLFGLLVVPLADWLDRTLPLVPSHEPIGLARGALYGVLTLLAALALLPSVSVFLFLVVVASPLGTVAAALIALATLVSLTTRRASWAHASMATAIAIGSIGTLISVGQIIVDGYS